MISGSASGAGCGTCWKKRRSSRLAHGARSAAGAYGGRERDGSTPERADGVRTEPDVDAVSVDGVRADLVVVGELQDQEAPTLALAVRRIAPRVAT